MPVKIQNKRASEQGSALVYILIAIALLAALTFTFMEPSSQQTSSQNTFKTQSAVQGQADIIRSAIQECVLGYPQGDKCINGDAAPYCTTIGTTDPGARENYPINPASSHYAGATPAAAADRLVRDLRCPGNNPGDGPDHDDHEPIFVGSSGKFLPPPPDLFEDWRYYNGPDGIYFWTQTDKTDSFLLSALQKLDEKYSQCESDIINATGGDVDLDSDTPAETQCPDGYTCFRVWMITNPSALYQVGSPELAAGCP